MIIFEDIETDTQMRFGISKDSLFYFEMFKVNESAYSQWIELEDNEVQHLINVLSNHLNNKANGGLD